MATSVGLPNPCGLASRILAVLFDLDGTLYRQPPVRALMAAELAARALVEPVKAWPRWKALAAYRRAHERLRVASPGGSVADVQLRMAASSVGLPVEDVRWLVEEWMIDRPLRHVRRWRAHGLGGLLELLERRGIRAGVLSDYPVRAKLRALGLEGRFAPALCSTDPEIDMVKPHPRGFLRACEIWGFEPPEVLVVGDRIDVDAAGAAAAGMPCVIIGRARSRREAEQGVRALPSLERLHRVLDEER